MKSAESTSAKLAETIALLESGNNEPCTASELYGFMSALLWVLVPEPEKAPTASPAPPSLGKAAR